MKSKRKAPAFASFVSVASAWDDTLIKAKLEFFVAVTKLQEFLLKFVEVSNQSSNDSLTLSLKDLLLAITGCF